MCLPIPILPVKHSIKDKLTKKKDDPRFILERIYFLNRFLKRLATYDFIIESDEFKKFSRNN